MGDTSAASSSHQEDHPTAPSHRAVPEGAGLTPDATASAMTAPSRTAISLTVNRASWPCNILVKRSCDTVSSASARATQLLHVRY